MPTANRRTAIKHLLAFVILVGLLAGADAPRLRFRAGTPRPVATLNPKIGVHTRLTDEVEEYKISRTLELVREMGSPWIVEYFPWAYSEPAPGRYDFDHAEMVIEHAAAAGLTVIARLDYVPAWARPADSPRQYLDPAHYDDFATFAFAFAGKFRSRLHHYIVWNEPNLRAEWGYRPVNPAEYAALLKAAYTRIKAADPEAIVLAAGLAPTLGDAEAMNDLAYLELLYLAGAAPYFDALAAHAYGWGLPPDDPPAPERINFARVELLRQIMVAHGDADKPIYITEGGWNDSPRWTKAVRPAQRVTYTVRAYQKALEEWPWVKAVCLWAFRFPRPERNYRDYFAFVTTDFTPRPVYLAVQQYATGR